MSINLWAPVRGRVAVNIVSMLVLRSTSAESRKVSRLARGGDRVRMKSYRIMERRGKPRKERMRERRKQRARKPRQEGRKEKGRQSFAGFTQHSATRSKANRHIPSRDRTTREGGHA